MSGRFCSVWSFGPVSDAVSRWEEPKLKSVLSRRAGGESGSQIQTRSLVWNKWTIRALSRSSLGQVRIGLGAAVGIQGHVMTGELDRRCDERRERR